MKSIPPTRALATVRRRPYAACKTRENTKGKRHVAEDHRYLASTTGQEEDTDAPSGCNLCTKNHTLRCGYAVVDVADVDSLTRAASAAARSCADQRVFQERIHQNLEPFKSFFKDSWSHAAMCSTVRQKIDKNIK